MFMFNMSNPEKVNTPLHNFDSLLAGVDRNGEISWLIEFMSVILIIMYILPA